MMRFLPVSLESLLVELPSLDETLGLFGVLQAKSLPGIKDIIPAARTLLISFAPHVTSAAALAGQISQLGLGAAVSRASQCIEVPVDYNGEDLPDVASHTGLTVAEIIRRHTEHEYMVAFCGFAPGFGYLTGGDPALQVPRRKTPRTRIPAGSVALAGGFSGVYPQASPGGWQIIGTTPLKMWDLSRTPPALFQPGYHVRFIDRAKTARDFFIPAPAAPEPALQTSALADKTVSFLVLSTPLPALFQDLGRFGQTGQGVSSSGAMDRGALKAANRLVGNLETEPCLELTGGGFSFRSTGRTIIGFTGAPCDLTIHTAEGQMRNPDFYTPIALEADDVVKLSAPRAGARSYLSVRGGFDVCKPLNSAATDTLAGIGPDQIRAGARLNVKNAEKCLPVSLLETPALALPRPGETVVLDVVLGPRTDWFTPESLKVFSDTLWAVTAQANRVGIRLDANATLARVSPAELPSEGCVAGALEVPPDGKPLLLLADHPMTGGYPVIGAVTDYHLDLAGQIPIGAKIQFRPIAPFHEITQKPAIG